MRHRPSFVLSLAAIATCTILLAAGRTSIAQSSDPFAQQIVSVVYKWDSKASWGFMVYTDRNGQRCFRFGNPGFKPTIRDILGVNHKVCFEPGQTTLERSPTSTSVTGVAGQKGETTIETYYSGSVQQTGDTLDMTFQSCTRLHGQQDFRCVKPVRYVVRLQGEHCEVEVQDERSTWKVVERTCDYYPAR
jgi:hypothetical protein